MGRGVTGKISNSGKCFKGEVYSQTTVYTPMDLALFLLPHDRVSSTTTTHVSCAIQTTYAPESTKSASPRHCSLVLGSALALFASFRSLSGPRTHNCFPLNAGTKITAFMHAPVMFILTYFFTSSKETFSSIPWIIMTGASPWLVWGLTLLCDSKP